MAFKRSAVRSRLSPPKSPEIVRSQDFFCLQRMLLKLDAVDQKKFERRKKRNILYFYSSKLQKSREADHMRSKLAILICMCAFFMCIPSSAKEVTPLQPVQKPEPFTMTIPDEWVQRDESFLLSAPSGYDDPGFVVVPAPKAEE